MNDQLSFDGDGFETPEGVGWVYLGVRGGQVKLGWTGRYPPVRARELGLTLINWWVGSRYDERMLHHRFRKYRIDREWFLPGPELLLWLAQNKREPDGWEEAA